VIGDANSSFVSSAVSETTIKQLGGSNQRFGGRSRHGRGRVQSSVGGGSSHIIIDD
jgi:hypothetical protein